MTKPERKPIIPLSDEVKDRLRKCPKWVVMFKHPSSNALRGRVEHSFSMGEDAGRVYIHTNSWGNDPKAEVEEVKKDLDLRFPNVEVLIFDVMAEDNPFTIDIEEWLDDNATNPNTLSGVSDKFRARNAPFKMKD